MISEQKLQEVSLLRNIPVSCIKAVAEVESMGDGFMSDGLPVILFEPHIFWEQLVKRGINPKKFVIGNADILYPKWKQGAYGTYSEQPKRLARAGKIHREAALMSASWGKFQIMGFNYKICGCNTIQEFVNAMYESEDRHLELFINFIISKGLDQYLRAKNWNKFAEGYNGKSYKKNNYHIRLKEAEERYR